MKRNKKTGKLDISFQDLEHILEDLLAYSSQGLALDEAYRISDRVGELRICYHGTDDKTAEIIKAQGFNPGTYFGRHLEDALFMGGEYIFEVVFKTKEIPDNWQFRIKEKVVPIRIVRHYRLMKSEFYSNEYLVDIILKSNSGF